MRIDILFPVLPPTLDGIGDHTVQIARRIARTDRVRVLTAQSDPAPIPGVEIIPSFSISPPWGIRSVADAILSDAPDWLIVQFNQFSYGRWGLNPFLPLTLRRIRREAPSVRIAWMAHEDFVPASSPKFALMRLWQKAQFLALGRASDAIFFSIDPWVNKYGPWFPDTPTHHNPIGSNMPYLKADASVVRAKHDISKDAFVLGFFGTLRARLIGHMKAAMDGMRTAARADGKPDPVLLSVGPDGADLKARLPGHRVIDAGRLPAEDVSRHLQAMNLHLTPFIDGVSTRRGSFMAGLQHGVPTLGTHGPLTDEILMRAEGDALRLCSIDDPSAYGHAAVALFGAQDLRQRLGESGQRLYRCHFDFDVSVDLMLSHLRDPTVEGPARADLVVSPA
ncbi:glycosyltransferase family 4 protein [Longibacter sp.]|uniref:glycosyltransferase family 4 protein n=1 Tax=Longibacter sp. TaxID=2045415 RepID=UPI003EB8438D